MAPVFDVRNTISATEALKFPYWTQGAPCSVMRSTRWPWRLTWEVPYQRCAFFAPPLTDTDPTLRSSITILPPHGKMPRARLTQSKIQYLCAQTGRLQTKIPAGGFIAQDGAWEKGFITNLAPYKLPLLAYEGGQNFADGSTNVLNTLYMAVNRDLRMGQAYTAYFQQWKAGGGQLLLHYSDVGVESKYGPWGAVESIMQTTTPLNGARPKWQAIQAFISGTPFGGRVVWARSVRGQATTVPAASTNRRGT
jgi:hypothetical protein